MNIWVIIPVKSLSESKQRLASVLTVAERKQLMLDCLAHLLVELEGVTAVTQTLIVSSDFDALALADSFNVLGEAEPYSSGLNSGIRRGVARATASGATAVLILPADLPIVTAGDIEMVLKPFIEREMGDVFLNGNGRFPTDKHSPGLMSICSDKDQDGTNALFITPPHNFAFHFGPTSYLKHLQEAKAQNMIVHTVLAPGLQFDLDTVSDLQAFRQRVGVNVPGQYSVSSEQ